MFQPKGRALDGSPLHEDATALELLHMLTP